MKSVKIKINRSTKRGCYRFLPINRYNRYQSIDTDFYRLTTRVIIIAIVVIVFTIIVNLTVAVITISLWRIILCVGKQCNYNYTYGKLQVNLTFSSFALQENQ